MTATATVRTRPRAHAIVRVVAERVHATTRPSRILPRHAIAREAYSYVAHCSPDALKALVEMNTQPDRSWTVDWPGDDASRERINAFLILCTAVKSSFTSPTVVTR
jgi:hypothetical protein